MIPTIIIISLLLTSCGFRAVSSCDECNENEMCSGGQGIYPTYHCYEFEYYETNMTYIRNLTTEESVKSFAEVLGGDDMYCYVDNEAGNHCTCDIVFYPDGHNESKNCYCWNDLVVHYKCINTTEENVSVIKGVEI